MDGKQSGLVDVKRGVESWLVEPVAIKISHQPPQLKMRTATNPHQHAAVQLEHVPVIRKPRPKPDSSPHGRQSSRAKPPPRGINLHRVLLEFLAQHRRLLVSMIPDRTALQVILREPTSRANGHRQPIKPLWTQHSSPCRPPLCPKMLCDV